MDRVAVLESFGRPHERTNPYLIRLFESFPDDVRADYFSWGRALRGDYDVFHVHWPEALMRGPNAWRSFRLTGAFLLTMLRIRITGRGLVRTLHNLKPHEALNPVQTLMMRLCDRWTTVWITLNSQTPVPTDAPVVVAPIGHVRDVFDTSRSGEQVRGRLTHFGLVRRYKGIDTLLDRFDELPDDDLTLHVIGATQDEALRERLEHAVRSDGRVTWIDEYVPDDVLCDEIRQAELVVLPFSDITNSSSLVVALSLDRPVLVPSGASTDEIAAEVGPGWVHRYDGPLRAETIIETLREVRDERASGVPGPDLSGREWRRIGELHDEAFRLARSRRRRR